LTVYPQLEQTSARKNKLFHNSAAEIRFSLAILLQAAPMFMVSSRLTWAFALHLKRIEEKFNRLLTTSIY
jgi:hypothetical protein